MYDWIYENLVKEKSDLLHSVQNTLAFYYSQGPKLLNSNRERVKKGRKEGRKEKKPLKSG